MAVTNTASALEFDNDTYRENAPHQEDSLKFRFAAEYTVDNSERGDTIATSDGHGGNEVRLTNRFGRMVLRQPHINTRIIDDIKQKFSGVVIDIDYANKEFTAQISDLSCPDKPDELITLGFDEIQDSDLQLLARGDSFVWYIGYVQGQMISREGFSKIRFRRLPTWSQREVEDASIAAEELFNFFHGNTDTTT